MSVSQVSEVTTFDKFLSEFNLVVLFANRFWFFRTYPRGGGGEGVTLLWTSIPSRREYQYS